MKPPRAAVCCAAAGLLLLVVTGFGRSWGTSFLTAETERDRATLPARTPPAPGRQAAGLPRLHPSLEPGSFAHEARGSGEAFYASRRHDRVHVPQCRVRLIDEVELASEQTGVLDALSVEGSVVRAGSVVARIRDDLLRATLAIAEKEAANEVEVNFARKASEFAQLKYIRAMDANRAAPGTVSELDLYELRLAAERSLQQIELAEHQLAMAGLKRDETRTLLERYTVEAPFDAFVREVYKQPGEVVREGEPIMTLVNTGRVRVEGYLPLEELHLVRPGQFVEVVCEARRTAEPPGRAARSGSSSHVVQAGSLPPAQIATAEPGRFGHAPVVCEGRLAFVDVKVEPVSGKVRVWAEVRNRDNVLRDGMTATMTIRCDPPASAHHSPLTTHQSP